jgi:hypothetical protein
MGLVHSDVIAQAVAAPNTQVVNPGSQPLKNRRQKNFSQRLTVEVHAVGKSS